MRVLQLDVAWSRRNRRGRNNPLKVVEEMVAEKIKHFSGHLSFCIIINYYYNYVCIVLLLCSMNLYLTIYVCLAFILNNKRLVINHF